MAVKKGDRVMEVTVMTGLTVLLIYARIRSPVRILSTSLGGTKLYFSWSWAVKTTENRVNTRNTLPVLVVLQQ